MADSKRTTYTRETLQTLREAANALLAASRVVRESAPETLPPPPAPVAAVPDSTASALSSDEAGSTPIVATPVAETEQIEGIGAPPVAEIKNEVGVLTSEIGNAVPATQPEENTLSIRETETAPTTEASVEVDADAQATDGVEPQSEIAEPVENFQTQEEAAVEDDTAAGTYKDEKGRTRFRANDELAAQLNHLYDVLVVGGYDATHATRYPKLALAISRYFEDVQVLHKEGRLRQLTGVGLTIERILSDLLTTGTSEKITEPNPEAGYTPPPPGVLEMLTLPRVGAKTVRALWATHEIMGLRQLYDAMNDGRVTDVKGVGPSLKKTLKERLGIADEPKPIAKKRTSRAKIAETDAPLLPPGPQADSSPASANSTPESVLENAQESASAADK